MNQIEVLKNIGRQLDEKAEVAEWPQTAGYFAPATAKRITFVWPLSVLFCTAASYYSFALFLLIIYLAVLPMLAANLRKQPQWRYCRASARLFLSENKGTLVREYRCADYAFALRTQQKGRRLWVLVDPKTGEETVLFQMNQGLLPQQNRCFDETGGCLAAYMRMRRTFDG